MYSRTAQALECTVTPWTGAISLTSSPDGLPAANRGRGLPQMIATCQHSRMRLLTKGSPARPRMSSRALSRSPHVSQKGRQGDGLSRTVGCISGPGIAAEGKVHTDPCMCTKDLSDQHSSCSVSHHHGYLIRGICRLDCCKSEGWQS